MNNNDLASELIKIANELSRTAAWGDDDPVNRVVDLMEFWLAEGKEGSAVQLENFGRAYDEAGSWKRLLYEGQKFPSAEEVRAELARRGIKDWDSAVVALSLKKRYPKPLKD